MINSREIFYEQREHEREKASMKEREKEIKYIYEKNMKNI
jgi:hypothetical protein